MQYNESAIYHRVCENVSGLTSKQEQMHSADPVESVLAISFMGRFTQSCLVPQCGCEAEMTARGQMMGGQVSIYREVAFL